MNKPGTCYKIILALVIAAFLNLITFPTTAWALTNGPMQIDYTGFESNPTDMVNLFTGDFTYSIPLLNVPSPEGGFSFPISYHSGIQMDQEASWVGLGWGLNVGAITRTIAQFPDDFKGEISENHYKHPGRDGWIKNFLVGNVWYDSEEGRGGTVNLGIIQFGWGSAEGVSALGISYEKNREQKVDVDPVEAGIAIATITAAAYTGGASAVAQALATDAVVGITVGAVVQSAAAISQPNGRTLNPNHWTVNMPGSKLFTKNHYSSYLDYDEDEKMYGSIYLGDIEEFTEDEYAPSVYQSTAQNPYGTNDAELYSPEVFDKAITSDMHMNFLASQLGKLTQPSHIAYDNYQVMGKGVSGAMAPYRHDQGSLAYAERNGGEHMRYNVVKYLPTSSHEVNFNYVGEMANEYRHHALGPALDVPLLGMSANVGGQQFTGHPNNSPWTHFTVTDPKLLDNNLQKVEANRPNSIHSKGLNNNHLSGSKYVKWYSNSEIIAGVTDGFIDMEYPSGMSKADFRNSRNGYPYSIPSHGIGGFQVVSSNGTTYHYALPVYNIEEYSYVGTTSDIGPNAKFGKRVNVTPYAVSWLLTAITGPDFYDRDSDGIIDDDDWGRWVKFDYGRLADAYKYKSPYHKAVEYSPLGPGTDDRNNSSTEGKRELYYLDKIETRTHTALFVKNERFDGRSHYNDAGAHPTSKVRLDEIILLTNEDYKTMEDTYLFTKGAGGTVTNYMQLQQGESIDKVIDVKDIEALTGLRTFVTEQQVQRIVFNYAEEQDELCDGTYNSFKYTSSSPSVPTLATSTGKRGKLTLKGISTYAKNDKKYFPDYDFHYSIKNPNYDPVKWDQWGMYYASATDAYNGHGYTSSLLLDKDEDYWHLKRIVTPTGSEILIDYERDSYASISGNPLLTPKDGGNVRVKQVTVKDELGGILHENKTKYLYHLVTDLNRSSGVCAVEPIWSRTTDYPFYKYFEYPNTPIQYKNVTVLSGVKQDGTYLNKKTFDFETLDHSHYTVSNQPIIGSAHFTTRMKIANQLSVFGPKVTFVSRMYLHSIQSNLAAIGRVNWIKEYNNRGHLQNSSRYEYVDAYNYDEFDQTNPIPGVRTESSWVNFKTVDDVDNKFPKKKYYHNFSKTIKVRYPNILDKVDVMQDGYHYTIENEKYDFVTGNILEQKYSNSLGYQYWSKSLQAQDVYPEMGNKVDNPAYKNMLAQSAGEYLEVYDPDVAAYLAVKGAIQTWKKDWEGNNAWRQHAQYVWNSEINKDGTYNTSTGNNNPSFVPFNFSTPPTGWQKVKEVTRYNNYTYPEEVLSGSNIYSASRKDNQQVYIIASVSNSKYGEFTYSGAELDKNSDNEYNGEITTTGTVNRIDGTATDIDAGTGGVQPLSPHTGGYVYELATNASLNFESVMGTMITPSSFYPIRENKVYRLSYWQHDLNYNQATKPNLKVEFWGGGTWQNPPDGTPYISGTPALINPPKNTTLNSSNLVNCNSTRFGEWHLVDVDILVETDKAVELKIYLQNPGSLPIYIDDLRILPLDASMTSNVIDYDLGTLRLKATLDNQNIATRYTYFESEDYKVNKIKKIEREVIDDPSSAGSGGFKKVMEKEYNVIK